MNKIFTDVPKTQQPDGRLFVQATAITWITNRSYKTERGAEAFMHSIAVRHPRRNITMSVRLFRSGEYRVVARWAKPVKKVVQA